MTDPIQFSQSLRRWMDVFSHRSMHDWSHYVKASGFSMPQFFLLMHVRYHNHCSISALSERMGISPAAVSQLVDKLVHTGLLERTEDPDDRRARQVALSTKGKDLIKKGLAERYRWVDDLAESLNIEQRASVSEALEILTGAAQEIGLSTIEDAHQYHGERP